MVVVVVVVAVVVIVVVVVVVVVVVILVVVVVDSRWQVVAVVVFKTTFTTQNGSAIKPAARPHMWELEGMHYLLIKSEPLSRNGHPPVGKELADGHFPGKHRGKAGLNLCIPVAVVVVVVVVVVLVVVVVVAAVADSLLMSKAWP